MHDITGEDLDSWKESTVYVNWKVTDDESGLDYCEWAIGKYSIYGYLHKPVACVRWCV